MNAFKATPKAIAASLSRRTRVWLIVSIVVIAAAAGAWHWNAPLPQLAEIRHWADSGQWERADVAAGELVSRRPRDADALMLAARIAAARGDLQRCVTLLEKVPQESPRKPDALTRQAQAEQYMNHARRAELAWRALVECSVRDPDQSKFLLEARAQLISLLSLERRTDEMAALLWEMYPTHTERWRLLIGLIRSHSRGATPQSAIEILERFVAQDPADLDAQRALALACIDTFQWDRATELANNCLAQEPDDKRSMEILLECYVKQRHSEAIDELIARMKPQQLSSRALRLYAQYLEFADELDKAVAACSEALQLDPWDSTTHYQLAQLLQRAGRGEMATKHLAEFQRLKRHEDALTLFVSKFPQSSADSWVAPEPALCVEAAENCLALGRTNEARGWLDEALGQQPDFSAALELRKKID